MRIATYPAIAALLAGCPEYSTELKDNVETGLDAAIDSDDPADITDGDPVDDGDNQAPTADAGADATLPAGQVAELDGSASSDPDGDTLTFAWEFVEVPSGSVATLLNDTYEDPSFYADVPGLFVVRLTVSDGVATDTDDVNVEISDANIPPTADAGVDQFVGVSDLVMLSGSNSFDPDGDPLEYEWDMTIRPGGSSAFLMDETTAFPRFTADVTGTYTIELRVFDGIDWSFPDSVRVTAQDASDDGCLSCAYVESELSRRGTSGHLNGAPLLLLFLPLSTLWWARRRNG